MDAPGIRAALIQQLAIHSIPVLPQSTIRVIELLSDPVTPLHTLADTILRDQTFALRVLKLANSAFFRRGHEITIIRKAIEQIGYAKLREIAVAANYADLAQKRLPSSIDLRRLLARAFVAARVADALGKAALLSDADGPATCALLESLGDLALTLYLPKVAGEIKETAVKNSELYEAAHLAVTGLTPHDVTKIVATAHELPKQLILSPPPWATPAQWTIAEKCQAIVHLSNFLAYNLFSQESPKINENFTAIMSRATDAFQLSPAETETLLAQEYRRAVELGAVVNLDSPCFALGPYMPGDSPRTRFLDMCANAHLVEAYKDA